MRCWCQVYIDIWNSHEVQPLKHDILPDYIDCKFELILLFSVHIYGFRRNEVVLEAGEKYRFNEDGSEMTLLDVAKLDEGEYTCIAKNKAGESEQELSLRVFGEHQRSAEWQFKCSTCGAERRRGRNNHLFCERLDERCCSTWVELISCEEET